MAISLSATCGHKSSHTCLFVGAVRMIAALGSSFMKLETRSAARNVLPTPFAAGTATRRCSGKHAATRFWSSVHLYCLRIDLGCHMGLSPGNSVSSGQQDAPSPKGKGDVSATWGL